MKILIVDDDPDMVSSLARNIKGAGFQVESASNGEEAIAKNLTFEPDAILMDVRMPRLNGIDACLEVQQARPEVRVILMTGFSESLDEANQEVLAQACQKGRVELMTKPLDLDRVMALLRGEGESDRSAGHSAVSWQENIDQKPKD